jgi:hypothetical protein
VWFFQSADNPVAVAYFAELNHHTGIKIAVIIDFKIMIQHQDWFFDSFT